MQRKNIIAGVLGNPIAHSKSPILHRFWLKQNKIKGFYIPLKVSDNDLEMTLRNLPKIGFSGVNVTVPHKESVMSFAKIKTERASLIGSANTLTFLAEGGFKADNTDGYGFMKNLEEQAPVWDPKEAKVLILGAGGACRAVIGALLESGVKKLHVTNRTQKRAKDLQVFFNSQIELIEWSEKEELLKNVNTVINATTLGMVGSDELQFSLSKANENTTIVDLVYNPINTPLLVEAHKKGCQVVNGIGMLLHQATPGFKEWYGVKPTITKELLSRVMSK
jgi:shikimate dehydrogenase